MKRIYKLTAALLSCAMLAGAAGCTQYESGNEKVYTYEEAIKELNKLYVAHANFLEKYSPFEQRNLSQECSLDKLISPGVLPQAEGREECDGRADSDT